MSGVATPETMDAAWFSRCLERHGHKDVTVRQVRRSRIGTGQIGLCVRFELDLEAPADSAAPRSLVGKFPSDDPDSRATGVALRNYYREVSFYRQLAPRLGISLPRCYHAEIEGEGPEFALLLEDMQPARQGDQLEGCTAPVARAAVLELVGLQAPSWCDQSLLDYDWLTSPDMGDPTALYAQMLPGFLERYGAALADDERDIIARVAVSPGCPLFAPLSEPFCLEHVDYRLDNMLIDDRTDPPRVTVVDWQSVRVGRPLNDVAYFLGAGLLPEARREAERDIVSAYHQRLTDAGVDGYDWSACWADYRRGAFSGFGVTVIASMLVGRTERGDRMFITMARRHARHALDLGAAEFLD